MARAEDAMNLRKSAQRNHEPGHTGNAMLINRRTAERKRQRLIDGFLISKGKPRRPCTVCDMSATGSRVEVWNDGAKPLLPGERVTLYIPSDRKEIDAEVRWRRSSAVGLRFTSVVRAPSRPHG
jgi:hypothetical protein